MKESKIDASDKRVIIYGNGNYGVVKAVLEFHGVSKYPITVFEGGYAEWTEKKAKTQPAKTEEKKEAVVDKLESEVAKEQETEKKEEEKEKAEVVAEVIAENQLAE